MLLHKFYFDAQTRARIHHERYGQAMFNHLDDVRPNLAKQIRGTDKDPFHVERLTHPNWDRFVTWLEAEWYKVDIYADNLHRSQEAGFKCNLCENPIIHGHHLY